MCELGRGQLSTELTISSEEFDIYDIYECPVTIAFHLREFTVRTDHPSRLNIHPSQASIVFADSTAQSLDFRFTDPAAPLFIDVEGDNVDTLFIISTSQVQGGTLGSQGTSSQAVNMRKRERDRSESEAPRLKKPLKVVQEVDPEMDRHHSNYSRGTSRIPGSMPPPPTVPNRSTFHAIASQGPPHVPMSRRENPRQDEPLFLPSSQLSVTGLEILRSTGLGIENMSAAEITEMLEGEGEEVDFSHVSQPLLNINQSQDLENMPMQLDGADSLEIIDDELAATQSTNESDKVDSTNSCWFFSKFN